MYTAFKKFSSCSLGNRVLLHKLNGDLIQEKTRNGPPRFHSTRHAMLAAPHRRCSRCARLSQDNDLWMMYDGVRFFSPTSPV